MLLYHHQIQHTYSTFLNYKIHPLLGRRVALTQGDDKKYFSVGVLSSLYISLKHIVYIMCSEMTLWLGVVSWSRKVKGSNPLAGSPSPSPTAYP